jgi:protein TonB
VIFQVAPVYSEEAKAAKYQGEVWLRVVVDTNGIPTDIKVTRGLGLGLDEKAIEAVRQWRFKPGTKDGQPVPVQATIAVSFRPL